jgi:hypothetical protein
MRTLLLADTKVKSPADELATKLYNVLRTHGKTRAKFTKYHIELLRRLINKQPAREVKQVTEWYIANIDKSELSVSSIQGFIKRYWQIKAWFGLENPKQAYITPLAKEIAKHGDEYSWPAGCEDQLPLVIQMSMDNYIPFIRMIKNKVPASLAGLFKYTEDYWLTGEKEFLKDWIQWVNERIQGWDDFQGTMKTFVWKPDHWLFQNKGHKWTDEYGLPVEYWDKLIEELSK